MAGQKWQDVHVFVSSTFHDMHAERDYLVKRVFPKLRDWCEERRLRFVDVDLRWGVTEADTEARRTVQVCLERIDQCRPFFLCFLGQRYGSMPREERIDGAAFQAFPALRDAVRQGRSVTHLEVLHAAWRLAQERAPQPEVDGQGRDLPRGAPGMVGDAFFYLREPSYLAEMPGQPAALRRTYTNEADAEGAELAALDGKLRELRERDIPATRRPVRAYGASWRAEERTPELAMPLDCPSVVPAEVERWQRRWAEWAGVRTSASSVLPEDRDRAVAFNAALTAGRISGFVCHLAAVAAAPPPGVPDAARKVWGDALAELRSRFADGRLPLAEVVGLDLRAAIAARYPEHVEGQERSELEREVDQHETFITAAVEGFIRRDGDFRELDDHAGSDFRGVLAVVAPAGVGKSTLLANWVAKHRNDVPRCRVCARFIGVGERTATVDSLLRCVLEEMRAEGRLTEEIPDDPRKLRSEFGKLLSACAGKGPVLLVLDALNQLQSGLADLEWLPRELSSGVKLVVSFKVGEEAGDRLAAPWETDPRVRLHRVRPFEDFEDRRRLVRAFLKRYLKELDDRHLEVLIGAVPPESPLREAAANPLYLKVVLSELRVFGAVGQLGEKVRGEFGTSPQSAFDAVLRRLEMDPAHSAFDPKQLVPLLFGLLAHSFGGLPEELLVRILLAALGLGPERTDDVRDAVSLYLRQVRPFLAYREGRSDFFYESFQTAARDRYTGEGPGRRPATEWHRLLAETCGRWKELGGTAERYALANLVQHRLAAGEAEAAAAVLTDFAHLYRRFEILGADEYHGLSRDFAAIQAETADARDYVGFWATKGHVVRGLVPGACPEIILLQEARAMGAASRVGRDADAWLAAVGPEQWWLRDLGRRKSAPSAACVAVLETEEATEARQVAVAWADGLAVAAFDSRLRMWDLRTRRSTPVALTGRVESLYLSRGTCWAVSVDQYRSLACWTVDCSGAKKEVEIDISQRGRGVYHLAFVPRRELAVAASYDGTVRGWNLKTGACEFVIEDDAKCLAVSSDGGVAVTGGTWNALAVWDVERGVCDAVLGGHSGRINALAITPDGRRAVSSSSSGVLEVWDIACARRGVIPGPRYRVPALAVSADGRTLLSGGDELRVWDLDAGVCKAVMYVCEPGNDISRVFITRGGGEAVTWGRDKMLRVWNLEGGTCVRTLPDVESLYDVSPNGTLALTRRNRNEAVILDLVSGTPRRVLSGHRYGVCEGALGPDASYAVTATESPENTLRVWEVESSASTQTLAGHERWIMSLSLSGDGERIASVSPDDGLLRVSDRRSGCERLVTCSPPSKLVRLTANGRVAVTACSRPAVKVWDLETGACLAVLDGSELVPESVAVTDDARVAVSEDRGVLRVWDLQARKCVQVLGRPSEAARTVCVTPDGRYALAGCSDRSVRVWDLTVAQCVAQLAGHDGEVLAVSASGDGAHAMSGGRGRTVHIWDLRGAASPEDAGEDRPPVCSVVAAACDVGLAHLQGAGLTVWSLASGERIGSIEGIAFDRGSSPGLSPDGRWVAGDASWGTGGYGTNYGVALHDLATKKTANLADLRFVAFSADSQRLVATGDSRMGSRYAVARGIPIVAYTMMDGALVELWRMPRPPNLARLITVTADVRFAILRDVEVTCSGSKRFMQEKGLYVADLLSGESRHLVGYHGRLVLPSRMPAGRLFVWGDEGRELVEWDLASGRRLRSQRVDQVVAAMAFTPDDRWLVLWAGDRVYSWDVEQDRISWAPCQVRSYGAGLQLILAVDGRLCAVLTSGGPARVSADLLVLDVATGRLVATRRIQYGHIAAERSRILVGGLAGEVVVLELTPPGPWFSATG